MEKEIERSFLEVFTRALVSLPFDLKVLVEAVADPDLTPDVQELAAATLIHVLNPKDNHYEPFLRHAEDVILLRLALRHIANEGGEGAGGFRDHYADAYQNLDHELNAFRAFLGGELMDWIDNRWPQLKKAVYAKKTPAMFVEDEALGTFLYDETMQFATDYPITEASLDGRLKQAQPIVEHLERKRELDRMKISH